VHYKNILIADDDEIFIVVAKATLRRIFPDAEFIVASNGEATLDLLKKIEPDLLFLDLNMPIMNGKEFLVAMSQRYTKIQFPIIIVTSSIDPADSRETQTHPFVTGFVEKPISPEAVEKILQQPGKK
jgi:CheY-like chemotaxis protein